MQGLITLLRYLPEIVSLIEALKKLKDDNNHEREINDDIKTITEAFEKRDAASISKLFGGLPKPE